MASASRPVPTTPGAWRTAASAMDATIPVMWNVYVATARKPTELRIPAIAVSTSARWVLRRTVRSGAHRLSTPPPYGWTPLSAR